MTIIALQLSKCSGKLTYTVPRDCIGLVPTPKYMLKIRRAGTDCYLHEFAHDELDGNTVSFHLDQPIRDLANGYWQADLFAGCDWIGASILVKSLPTVTAASMTQLTGSALGCKPETSDNDACCPVAQSGVNYAVSNNVSLPGCHDATNCC